jgi:hypothetical protein
MMAIARDPLGSSCRGARSLDLISNAAPRIDRK